MPDCKLCFEPITERRVLLTGSNATKYCSKACAIKAATLNRAARRPKLPEIECDQCCKMFAPRNRVSKFCSRACSIKAATESRARRRIKVFSINDPFPPLDTIYLRAANIRKRRYTEHAVRHESGRGRGIGSGADQPNVGDDPDDFADFGDEPADLERAYADDAA